MITEHDLAEAIAECEGQRNPTSATCLKLAAYYTIRDQLFPQKTDSTQVMEVHDVGYSGATLKISDEVVDYSSETEFGRLVSKMDIKDVMPVMDDLMSTLYVISPRIYDGVIRKLSEI